MSDINELYQELIIDHGRRPRNFCVSESANCVQEGFNPLCGDRLTLYITAQDGIVKEATFVGSGCAISTASASLMTEAIKGKNVEETHTLFHEFHAMMTNQNSNVDINHLGKLKVLAGVAAFPARIKCATLAWHTLLGALSTAPKQTS